jgi:uncharacterized protein (DUF2062 family)
MRLPRFDLWTKARIQFRRLLRGGASPHAVAAGAALGFYFSCLPLPGQALVALALAWRLRLSKAAALLAANFHVPFFFFIVHWAWETKIGFWLLGKHMRLAEALEIIRGFRLTDPDTYGLVGDILAGWLLGAQVVGIPLAVVSYYLIFRAASAFHNRRHATRVRLGLLRRRTEQT